MKRKTPLKRKTRLRPANLAVKRAQARQRTALGARSGWRCEFLVILEPKRIVGPGSPAIAQRCGAQADDVCHIVPRRYCGKARDLIDTVLHGCRGCHTAYDDPALGDGRRVVVPGIRRLIALEAIEAHTKGPLPAKWRE